MVPDGWTIRVTGYLPVDDPLAARLRRVCAALDRLPGTAIHLDEEARVVTVDCAQAREVLGDARQVLRPLRIAERIVVKPPWCLFEPRPGDIVLEIDPEEAFGSGLHESTRLCLCALERHVKHAETAVDFGSGTGILAIAAAKLGVAGVIAIEAHPESARVARANVRRNGVERQVQVECASSLEAVITPVDLLTANLTAEGITAWLSAITSRVKLGGVLIFSGMTNQNHQEVQRLIPRVGCTLIERLSEGNWVALAAVKTGFT
ncbi:MAG: 50S ribosomal protein L11 methyltransferase, partial [Armatimonadota bacterium]